MRLDRKLAAAWLAACGCAAMAQLLPVDPDWREADAPPPPALRTTGLVPLDVPGSSLRFGVDPGSVTLGPDGVVRYVVVAQGAGGAINAMHEGIRCQTAQFRVYARHTPGSGWSPVKDADWRSLHGTSHGRHSLAIARGGACIGHAPNRSAAQIVRDLQAPADTRFNAN